MLPGVAELDWVLMLSRGTQETPRAGWGLHGFTASTAHVECVGMDALTAVLWSPLHTLAVSTGARSIS
jgi:hypothetical protein